MSEDEFIQNIDFSSFTKLAKAVINQMPRSRGSIRYFVRQMLTTIISTACLRALPAPVASDAASLYREHLSVKQAYDNGDLLDVLARLGVAHFAIRDIHGTHGVWPEDRERRIKLIAVTYVSERVAELDFSNDWFWVEHSIQLRVRQLDNADAVLVSGLLEMIRRGINLDRSILTLRENDGSQCCVEDGSAADRREGGRSTIGEYICDKVPECPCCLEECSVANLVVLSCVELPSKKSTEGGWEGPVHAFCASCCDKLRAAAGGRMRCPMCRREVDERPLASVVGYG